MAVSEALPFPLLWFLSLPWELQLFSLGQHLGENLLKLPQEQEELDLL